MRFSQSRVMTFIQVFILTRRNSRLMLLNEKNGRYWSIKDGMWRIRIYMYIWGNLITNICEELGNERDWSCVTQLNLKKGCEYFFCLQAEKKSIWKFKGLQKSREKMYLKEKKN